MVELVLIFGARGCGKTTLGLRLAKGWPLSTLWAYNPTADPRLANFPQWTPKAPPPTRYVLLFADEADRVWPNTPGQLEGWSYDVVELSRHRGVSIIANCRRPQTIHRSLRACASRIYLGPFSNRQDLDHCAKEWGEKALQALKLRHGSFQFVRIDP